MSDIVSILACSYSVVHAFLADFSKGASSLPDRTYLINLAFIFILVIQITSAVIYQLLSMATRSSKRGVGGNLTESLSFKTCFVYYSIFLILKMINPSMYPVHWSTLLGRESHAALCVHVCVCMHVCSYRLLQYIVSLVCVSNACSHALSGLCEILECCVEGPGQQTGPGEEAALC